MGKIEQRLGETYVWMVDIKMDLQDMLAGCVLKSCGSGQKEVVRSRQHATGPVRSIKCGKTC